MADEVAATFIQFYYPTLTANPAGLAQLYQATSVLTMNGQKFTGPAEIVEKFNVFPQQGGIQFDSTNITCDTQVLTENSMIILVSGQCKLGTQEHAIHFSQVFQLVALAPGNYYVQSEMFRTLQ